MMRIPDRPQHLGDDVEADRETRDYAVSPLVEQAKCCVVWFGMLMIQHPN